MDPSSVLEEAAFVHERDKAEFDVGVAPFITAFLFSGENAAQCVDSAKFQCPVDEVSG